MTGEFSRRSFLKYTADTAVAVAGARLLGGRKSVEKGKQDAVHQQRCA